VIAFEVIVRDEHSDRSAQMTLAQRNNVLRASLLDRTNRSANAFKLGLRAGSRHSFTSAESRRLLKCAV